MAISCDWAILFSRLALYFVLLAAVSFLCTTRGNACGRSSRTVFGTVNMGVYFGGVLKYFEKGKLNKLTF